MRTLVTGASGFIGRRVVHNLSALQAGEVIAAARSAAALDWPAGVRGVDVDLVAPGAAAELAAATRATRLVHLAWNATPGAFWTAPDNLDWAAASFALLRAFFLAGGQRAVMAGTCAEYDWTTGAEQLAETSPVAPATLYGVAKDATRRLACAAGDVAGAPVAWGRVFWLYGPDEAPGRLVSDVARALAEGRQVAVGEGRERRDFLHVDDVAAAFVQALAGEHAGPFNIGSGDARSVREVVSILAEAAGRPELIRWGEAPAPRAPSVPVVAADVGRLRTVVGAPPGRTLESGLAATLAAWRAAAAG